VEWIELAQNRDRWRAPVNAVMKLPVLAPRCWLNSSIGTTTERACYVIFSWHLNHTVS
jgi:hypothetical protein